jgi:esterase/lipase superfamily enzyme
LRALEERDEAQFFVHLREDLAAVTPKAAFVFIHGFNVTFAAAAQRAAQMAYDLFLVGQETGVATLSTVPILYSWPSNGETILYTHDANNAEASGFGHLKDFLKQVVVQSSAESITIIAHSMGSRALTTALNEIGLGMQPGDLPLVREIILAAPDIDRDVFRNIAMAVKRTGERITLYASERDKALQISQAINGFPRLGDARGGITVVSDVDSIDASVVGDDILAHSYYGETNLLVDLHAIIMRGDTPSNRFGLLAQGKTPDRYWIMRSRAAA